MSQTVRRLTSEGLNEFGVWIQTLRDGAKMPAPLALLGDEAFSEAVDFEAEVDAQQNFATRYDLGCHLVGAFRHIDPTSIARDTGLWSWLALLYFDQLCPADKSGQRVPRMNYTYILSSDFRHYPRHAVRTTWQMVSKYGEKALFLFSKSLEQRGELIEQLAARQELFACPAVIETASALYQDPERRTFKRGAASRTQGSVARYIKVLQQFQLTYDLFSMSAEDLLGLLPKEFDRFRAVAE